MLRSFQLAASFSKILKDPKQLLSQIPNGATILSGGFGICGIPENLICALRDAGTKDLTVVSNTGGLEDWGLGVLLQNKQIKKLIVSYVGENPIFEKQFLSGDVEVELTPQGTLAEKLRAAGAGIPGFFTATGIGTLVENGGIPIRNSKGGQRVEQVSIPKETRIFNGKKYLFEEALYGDYAFVKAQKADKKGNLVFNKTARNFNPDIAGAAKVTIAEVEQIVEPGKLDPDEIHLPGIFVDYIWKPKSFQRRHEKVVFSHHKEPQLKELKLSAREIIAKRLAREVRNGMYVNLGIGIPTLMPHYLDPKIKIELHSENGILGVGDYPEPGQEDPDLINAGKESITMEKGASTFSSSVSFGIVRGKHLDLTILGAMQVSKRGDIANWIIPKKKVKGMGGAMDLVGCGSRVIVAMTHCNKDQPKLLEVCSLPVTGNAIVNMVVTEIAVFELQDEELVLTEISSNASLEKVRQLTGFKFNTASKIGIF